MNLVRHYAQANRPFKQKLGRTEPRYRQSTWFCCPSCIETEEVALAFSSAEFCRSLGVFYSGGAPQLGVDTFFEFVFSTRLFCRLCVAGNVEALFRLDRGGAFVGHSIALFVERFKSLEHRFVAFFPAMDPGAEVFRLMFAHDRGFGPALFLT